MSPQERELVYQFREDVGLLSHYMQTGLPTPLVARAVFSPILRRWIGEGAFFRVQRLAFPTPIFFDVRKTDSISNAVKANLVDSWMSAVSFDHIGFAIGVPRTPPATDCTVSSKVDFGFDDELEQKSAKHFFNQKIIFFKQKFYSRVDLIRMHANKFGGVHIDEKRSEQEEHIDSVRDYFGIEITSTTNQMLVGSDVLKARLDDSRRPTTYNTVEIFAIDTAKKFVNGVRKAWL